MRRIALVRHAEIVTGPVDKGAPISQEGVAQSKILARQLSPFEATAIFYSPYTRAMQTAQIISSRLLVPMMKAEGLAEIGKEERWEDMRERVRGALKRILKTTSGNVIVVSHGGPIIELGEYCTGRKVFCRRGQMITVSVRTPKKIICGC